MEDKICIFMSTWCNVFTKIIYKKPSCLHFGVQQSYRLTGAIFRILRKFCPNHHTRMRRSRGCQQRVIGLEVTRHDTRIGCRVHRFVQFGVPMLSVTIWEHAIEGIAIVVGLGGRARGTQKVPKVSIETQVNKKGGTVGAQHQTLRHRAIDLIDGTSADVVSVDAGT